MRHALLAWILASVCHAGEPVTVAAATVSQPHGGAAPAAAPADAFARLATAAKAYVDAKAKPEEGPAWDKKFQVRVTTRMETTGLGRDEAAQSVTLDWLTDNEKRLRAREPAAILQACRTFVWLDSQKIALPGPVREEMAKEDRALKLADFLETEAAKQDCAK